MARDPLAVLLQVRQRTVDQARQALAGCLKIETAAKAAIRAIDVAIEHEQAVANRLPEHHLGTNMVPAWLQRVREERARAVAALAAAESETAAARAVLTAGRSAAQAVQRTIAERAIIAQAEAERREQHALDDMTRGRRGGPDGEKPEAG